MSKTRCWCTIFFILAVLILIGFNIKYKDCTNLEKLNIMTPTYKINCSDTIVYNQEGKPNYRFVAQHVEYFSYEGIICFIQPVITIFNEDKIPTWMIRSDIAKLINNHMLYLHSNVEINSLIKNTQLRKIKMNNAQINLVTQDVISKSMVTLCGTTFHSTGLKMCGNLRNKSAKLIEKVITSYDI